MLIQVIVFPEESTQREKCLTWTEDDIAFAKFIQKIFSPAASFAAPP